MNEQIAAIAAKLKPYFEQLIQEDPVSGGITVWDEELGDRASCCTIGQAACFFAMDGWLNGGDGYDIAKRLAANVEARQLPSGAFGQPFYVKKGEPQTVDIAEIGAVANGLYHVYRLTGSMDAKRSLLRAADYLLTQVAKENPGAVYKRPDAQNHDVLNGDMYAAHAWGRAYELSGNAIYLQHAERTFAHLADRFGRNNPGWWPYTEYWDGTVGMGNSVGYQATIVAFGASAVKLLPPELAGQWAHVADMAVRTILDAMKGEPNDDNEAPWWGRDWNSVWEICIAYAQYPDIPEGAAHVEDRLRAVAARLEHEGLGLFRSKVKSDDPGRSPVTTTFRKAAGFAATVSYLLLDRTDVEK
ncbi:hypothetical protein [Paenibacillus contaminans]|uniref:Glycosyl hydrolase n=1 Tax=Paenibacillus contaminans TaxID=450362 RepID=A0A329MPE7_9BACL|nr:hypothetical protein [Paenibacillus contaminans]RAV19787.1 hypothetical protein DQG23_17750 [Paenibacillus contaminans]